MDSSRESLPRGVRLWQAALAGYWLTLFVATHLPSDLPLPPGDRADKLVHAVAFGSLAWLLAEAWQRSAGRLTGRHLLAAWLAIVVFAAIDEVTQIPVGRVCSFADWLADAAGAAAGLLLFLLLQRKSWRR